MNEITIRSEPAIRIQRSWVTILDRDGTVLGGASFNELPVRILVGIDIGGISLHLEPLDSGTVYLAADSQEVSLTVTAGEVIDKTWVFVDDRLRPIQEGVSPLLVLSGLALLGLALAVVRLKSQTEVAKRGGR